MQLNYLLGSLYFHHFNLFINSTFVPYSANFGQTMKLRFPSFATQLRRGLKVMTIDDSFLIVTD